MMSTFMQERAAKMKLNEANLLNIASGLIDAPEEEEKVIPAKRARALTTTTTAAKKRKAAAEFVPVRKSSRVAGNTISAEELEISREKEAELERNEYERVKKIKHDDRGMEESILSSVDGSGGVEDCLEMMKTLVQKVGEEKVKQEEDRDGQTKGRGRTTPKKSTTVIEEDDSKPGTSLSALKGILAKCELRSIVKVVPERIYSLVVHPSVDRDIVFAGDKWGCIAMWDCTDATEISSTKKVKGEKSDADKGKLFFWNQHGKHSVPCLRLHPTDQSSIFSSSYDCTVRSLNFETGNATEVIDGDVFGDEMLMHGIDLTQDGHSIWAADNQGGIIHRDLRSKISTAKRWEIDSRKVGSISINPIDNNFIVTAHLKRDMRIWDLRKILEVKGSGSVDKALRAEFTHGQACSSAYFSPTGKQILSTSYDDKMRIWNVDRTSLGAVVQDFNPDYVHKHNNQVGRYVSVLKAQWSNAIDVEPHWTAGNMSHPLDVVSGTGTVLAQFTHEDITAVPGVTASHPIIPGRYYGGTASGKVSIFSPPV